ncbi:MAG: type I restriction endonuclease subunit R, partial [Bacteroidetes bacterium]
EWEKLREYYKEETEGKFIQRLNKELDLRGMLDVIRHGITDSGLKFKLAYFKPDSGLNPETTALYKQNNLQVTRQVHFSAKNNKSIDLLLSLNGLPIATIELKNHFTGQRVNEAMEQYKTSRDPKEPLFQFKKRALVHFTVDSDDVYFTTKLESASTRFFPFNKGYKGGAGNPPAKDYVSYRTAYFWEEILSVDSWIFQTY